MRGKLTEKRIARVRPPATGHTDYFDAEDPRAVPGLHLRCYASGARTWRLVYRAGARQRVVSWPGVLPLAEARRHAREAAVRVARGEDPAAARDARRLPAPPAPTVARLVDAYLDDAAWMGRLAAKTRGETARLLRHSAVPRWGDRLVTAVTQRDVSDYLGEIVARGHGPMANSVREKLIRFGAWCVEKEYLAANPAAGTKRPAKPRFKDRVLTEAEVGRAWPRLPLPAKLQLLVGSRLGEMVQVQWRDVDLDARVMTFRAETTKTRVGRAVPLSAPVVTLLSEWAAHGRPEYVFPGRRGPLSFTWAAMLVRDALDAAGIPDASSHDLRRTAATWLGDLGVAPHTIGMILGHARSDRMTSVYDRARRLEEMRAAVEALGARVAAVVAGPGVPATASGAPRARAARREGQAVEPVAPEGPAPGEPPRTTRRGRQGRSRTTA